MLYGCYTGSERAGSPTAALQRDLVVGEDANQTEEEVRGATSMAEAQIAALQSVVARQKVAASSYARGFLDAVVEEFFADLHQAGHFYDPVE